MPQKKVVCRDCGKEFDLNPSKPGYANQCSACAAKDLYLKPSLRKPKQRSVQEKREREKQQERKIISKMISQAADVIINAPGTWERLVRVRIKQLLVFANSDPELVVAQLRRIQESPKAGKLGQQLALDTLNQVVEKIRAAKNRKKS